MRVALAVTAPGPDREANLLEILTLASQAADAGADLVLFPEGAITGFINNDDPSHDLKLGEPLDGTAVRRLAELARQRSIWLATGLFEIDAGRLYDSAILIGPEGGIRLRHRRTHAGWRHPKADPACYGEGTEHVKAETPLGSIMFVICGELFHDENTDPVREARPDLLLVPISRSMEGAWSQERWEAELPDYQQRVATIGCTTLMVNLASDGDFGGAWIFRADGSLAASLPQGRTGLLLADL